MALFFHEEDNSIEFRIPNSEASINAQHRGIKDRTVGGYYMSDRLGECLSFLSELQGEYYLDLPFCLRNARKILNALKEKRYESSFKQNLVPQQNALITLEWCIEQNGAFYKMPSPSINDQGKYLKLAPEDETVNLVKTLMLGDLTGLFFKKIGANGYLLYFDATSDFESKLNGKDVIGWMEK